MKIGIFTLAIILVGVINLSAQPLPDTIYSTKHVNDDFEKTFRLIRTYEGSKTKKTFLEYWNPSTNIYEYALDTTYTYSIEGKISSYSVNGSATNYFYNTFNQDSLIVSNGKKITFDYDAKHRLSAKKEYEGSQNKPKRFEFFEYDSDDNITLLGQDFYDNGILANQYEYSYAHYSDHKMKEESFRARNLAVDTTWYWQHKIEFKYLDADDNVDEKWRYNYFPNLGWKLSYKIGFTYTPTQITEVSGIDKAKPNYIRTTKYNDKGQITEFILRQNYVGLDTLKRLNHIIYTYRNDGAINLIRYYKGRINVADDSIYLSKTVEYKYRQPDISSDEDIIVQNNISIFPNPSSDVINIVTKDASILATRLFDQTGRLLQSTFPNEHQTTMFRNDLPSGAYFIQVTTTNGVVTKPIILL